MGVGGKVGGGRGVLTLNKPHQQNAKTGNVDCG